MQLTGLAVVLALLWAAVLGWHYGPGNTVCVKPSGGGACMTVHRAHTNRPEAAAALLRVREMLFVATAYLREKYRSRAGRAATAEAFIAAVKPDRLTTPSLAALGSPARRAQLARGLADTPPEPIRQALAGLVAGLLLRWNPDEISEGSPLNLERETAYTVGHGREMVYCLRAKAYPHAIHPDHVLNFVALHELTHVFTPGFVHPACFWEHFRWVLHEMAVAGIYAPPDFSEAPEDYCGISINHSPATDRQTSQIWTLHPRFWGSCGAN